MRRTHFAKILFDKITARGAVFNERFSCSDYLARNIMLPNDSEVTMCRKRRRFLSFRFFRWRSSAMFEVHARADDLCEKSSNMLRN